MHDLTVFAIVAGLVGFFLLAEVIAAAVPLIIVLAFVPAAERTQLAELVAAADSSRRLRLWPALRLAVRARRRR